MTFEEWWQEAHGTAPKGDRNHLRDIGQKSVAEDAWRAANKEALEILADREERAMEEWRQIKDKNCVGAGTYMGEAEGLRYAADEIRGDIDADS